MLYLYSLSVKWCNAELCADIAVVFVIQNDSRVVNQEIHGQKFQLLQKNTQLFPKMSHKVWHLVCQYVLTAHVNIVAPPPPLRSQKSHIAPPQLHFLYAALIYIEKLQKLHRTERACIMTAVIPIYLNNDS